MRGEGQLSHEEMMLLGAAMLTVVIALLIYRHPQIVTIPWYLSTQIEIWMAGMLSPILPDDMVVAIGNLDRQLSNREPWDIQLSGLITVDQAFRGTSSWLASVILLGLGLKRLFNGEVKYDKTYDLESLLDTMSQHNRYLRYLIKRNPLKESGGDMTNGPWRNRDKVDEYCLDCGLATNTEEGFKVHEDQVTMVAARQLGRSVSAEWRRHEKLLLVAFCYRLKAQFPEDDALVKSLLWLDSLKGLKLLRRFSRDPFGVQNLRSKEARMMTLFGDISCCYAEEMDFDVVYGKVEYLFDHLWKDPVVVEFRKEHEYIRTMLMGMLEAARETGTLQTPYFGWLKIEDRVLWYCLNDLGIPEPSIEARVCRSHYLMEQGVAKKGYPGILQVPYDGNLVHSLYEKVQEADIKERIAQAQSQLLIAKRNNQQVMERADTEAEAQAATLAEDSWKAAYSSAEGS